MRKMSNYLGEELKIFQNSIWRREFELRSGNELIARLFYPKFFSDPAELNIWEESYEFYCPKFFKRDVDIRKKGYQNPFASFKNNFWGSKGVLELPRGVKLNIKTGYFRKQSEMYLRENEPLITIFSKFSIKEKSLVVIEKRSEVIDDHPWIIMFGFYLAVLLRRTSTVGK